MPSARPAVGLFVSGLSAGLDLGFSLFLMAVMWTQTEGALPKPIVGLLVANMYAVGFIFVVLGRSELFTEQTTLAVLPVLRGRASIGALLRLWGLVYAANMIGVAAFAGLATLIGPVLEVIDPRLRVDCAQADGAPGTSHLLDAVLRRLDDGPALMARGRRSRHD